MVGMLTRAGTGGTLGGAMMPGGAVGMLGGVPGILIMGGGEAAPGIGGREGGTIAGLGGASGALMEVAERVVTSVFRGRGAGVGMGAVSSNETGGRGGVGGKGGRLAALVMVVPKELRLWDLSECSG